MQHINSARPLSRQAGTTLVESLLGAAIAAIALGSALPGFEQARVQRHLDGTAAQLETDIQFARSLASSGNHSVRMAFTRDAAGSCYVVHTGDSGACTCAGDGSTQCNAGGRALRSVRFGPSSPVQLSANVRAMVFDPQWGTVTPTSSLRLVAPNAQAVHVITNVMGRVRACTPSVAVRGYPAC